MRNFSYGVWTDAETCSRRRARRDVDQPRAAARRPAARGRNHSEAGAVRLLRQRDLRQRAGQLQLLRVDELNEVPEAAHVHRFLS